MPDEPDKLIVRPGISGYSERMTVGGRKGRFNWSEKPRFHKEIGSGKSPMFLFITDEGNAFHRRLEKDKQGGRWEESEHAEEDWMDWTADPKQIAEHWGQSDISEALTRAIQEELSWDQVKELLKNYDTWRQISGD